MLYSRVNLQSIGYEQAPYVLTSDEIEERLQPAYRRLFLRGGRLASWTGVHERRLWAPGDAMAPHAAEAGRRALERAGIRASALGMLIYAGVCRDQIEPATACAVAHELGVSSEAQVFDLSNACLGVLHGMVHVANAIELGAIRAGLVVSCESSRQIIGATIDRLNGVPTMEMLQKVLATMTGGSGAVGVVLTDRAVHAGGHRLLGATMRNASEHHALCRWGPPLGRNSIIESEMTMDTDAVAVLKHGVSLGRETYRAFRDELAWSPDEPDKVICHQVGSAHRKAILRTLEIPAERDFITYPTLGNMGTVSLPMTAAIAAEEGFLRSGDGVAFLGIGSGLNCLMLGLRW